MEYRHGPRIVAIRLHVRVEEDPRDGFCMTTRRINQETRGNEDSDQAEVHERVETV
jgi:hypothetical protein